MKNANFLITLGLIFLAMACNQTAKESTEANAASNLYQRPEKVESAENAFQLLVEGNQRFVSNLALPDDVSNLKRKSLKENGQKPFAVILTCSDSRVPPELLFDQGLGDLFVIRVAGNVIDSVGMGSIQYAVEHLGIQLVIVLGHEKCGAVHATIEGGEFPGSVSSIARRIEPSIANVKSIYGETNFLEELVIKANIDENVNVLTHDELLKHSMASGTVKAIGALYHLESGTVEFFDAKPVHH